MSEMKPKDYPRKIQINQKINEVDKIWDEIAFKGYKNLRKQKQTMTQVLDKTNSSPI